MPEFKSEFPILSRAFYDKPLAYLDSAATSQKPQCVIDAISRYYSHGNANVHRGIYALSEEATKAYEAARKAVRSFINAQKSAEVIFTKGTTESINLVASSYGQAFVKTGDEIVISVMEHHSNIVPWQLLCERTGATLKVIPISDEGVIDLSAYKKLLNPRVKMVGVTHVSNALGIVNPIKEMIELAHENHIPVLIDGAQATPHMPVDVVDLDCDFYVFSAHKMYGPTGVGVLYAKQKWLEQMPPYQGGGDMIKIVTFEKTEYNELPYKFEAGTPNMAGVAGLEAAVSFMQRVGRDTIVEHEKALYHYAQKQLQTVPGLKIIGEAPQKVGALSFVVDAVHPHDISTILDQHAVAVRAGHHCAMPLMRRLGLAATARASFGIYNEFSDIDRLCEGLNAAVEMFSA
jgi:cysteine desulfurase/selenocysteine lyase